MGPSGCAGHRPDCGAQVGGCLGGQATRRPDTQPVSAGTDKAHAKGIKVIGATLLPIQNSQEDTPTNEAARQAVNKWIREARRFDTVLDFEKVVQDPQNPLSSRQVPGIRGLHESW